MSTSRPAQSLQVDSGLDPASLEGPLGDRLGAAVFALRRVPGAGSSNETFTAELAGDGGAVPVVVRLVVPFQQVFLGTSVTRQAAALRWVGEHGSVPVPRVLAVEEDPAVLGAPFLVMTRSPGAAPLDFPSYAVSGFVADLDPDARHALWHDAVTTLARLHTTDVAGLALPGLPDVDGDVLGERVEYLRRYRREAAAAIDDPVLDAGLDELERTVPAHAPRGLSWGDARYGNMLFAGGRCSALLDWELVSLAGPLWDLAWWSMFDVVHARDLAGARLEGLGTPAETVALWAELTGHPVDALEWHQLAVHLLLAMIRHKAFTDRAARGLAVPPPDDPRSVSRLLDRARTLLG